MDFNLADPIARTLLYEGYSLYPYRSSALKNREPCTFGSLYPKDWSVAGGDIEPWFMESQFLVRGGAETSLEGRIRFLQFIGVDNVATIEREVVLPERRLFEIAKQPTELTLDFPEGLRGQVAISVECSTDSVGKVRARIENLSPVGPLNKERPVAQALMSTHAIFGVKGGRCLSMIDPPEDVRELAESCRNRGAWPVLVGDPAHSDMILAAPIILYDFPQVAPESPGNLFDGTEIDELLTLRILTLADSEKQAMTHNLHTRELLARTENLAAGERLALHGATRNSHALQPGSRVRLHPQGRADVVDLALEGELATIASIEQDYEGRTYYAVTVDADPGRDLGRAGKPGHRFFFRLEELESA